MAEDVRNNILNSVKKMLGILPSVTAFDDEIIIYINSAIASLVQMGIGNPDGFTIDTLSKWSDFLGDDKRLESVKSYVYMKVRLIFDPPSSATVIESYKELIKEFEWRNYIVKDNDRINGR